MSYNSTPEYQLTDTLTDIWSAVFVTFLIIYCNGILRSRTHWWESTASLWSAGWWQQSAQSVAWVWITLTQFGTESTFAINWEIERSVIKKKNKCYLTDCGLKSWKPAGMCWRLSSQSCSRQQCSQGGSVHCASLRRRGANREAFTIQQISYWWHIRNLKIC